MISISSFARQSSLLLLCCGAIGVLGTVMVNNPTKSNLQVPSTFDFPQQVPLPNSTMLSSKPLTTYTFQNGMLTTGKSYRYSHNPQPIDIEVRYLIDGVANRPTMDHLLPIFTKIPATVLEPSTMKEQPGLGFYSLFTDQKTAYFGTCINPQGITTVTGDQFHSNSNPNPLSNGIQFDRLLPWLLGKQTLRDSRCLWTVLSTPIDPAAPDATMKTLQTVGVNWIRWWQAHFPAA
jgi:cyanosortase A-associated protein